MYPRVQTLVVLRGGRLVEVGRRWHPFGWPRPAWVASHLVRAQPLQGVACEFDAMAWDCITSAWDRQGVWGLYPHAEWSQEWPIAPFWMDVRRTRVDQRWHEEATGPRWRHRTTLDGLPGVLEVTSLATGHRQRSELTPAQWDARELAEGQARAALYEQHAQRPASTGA